MTFSLETPAARLVRQEKPATSSARARAWMTSSTVDMPTASAPSFWSIQTSASVSYCGQIEKLGRADQRRCSGEIDVIGYHHPFARFEFWIERAGGVGDDQLLDSGFGDYANNRCDFAR